MKKAIITALIGTAPFMAFAQSAVDAYQLAQPELRGTARFMAMGGAFGALGGNLSTLTQNPGGIGVYRGNDVGVTLNLDIQSVKSMAQGFGMTKNQTKFNCNNFGYVGSIMTNGDFMPVFNWGASYSRTQSFDRAYHGRFNSLNGSLSNYVAGYTNGIPSNELLPSKGYNPYQDSFNPWISILGYNSYIINPIGNSDKYTGLWQDGTSGTGGFDVLEKGYVDEYSINFGGNIMNTVYWGMGFGITDINYESSTYYEEDLNNALIPNSEATGVENGNGGFGLDNWKRISGNGFNFKTGIIVAPINELRFGLAVHTPTYYNLSQEGWAQIDYGYSSGYSNTAQTDEGYTDYFEWKYRTPWRLIASVAGVIESQFIVSFDYEYRPYQNMNAKDNDGNQYNDIKGDIETYYKTCNIFRLGGEYRINRNLSARIGYSSQSSPSTAQFKNNDVDVWTFGVDETETQPSYQIDDKTQYITCGLGYRYKELYIDAAYVHKNRKSTFHAYTPNNFTSTPPSAKITDNNNQIVLTLGMRF